MTPASALSDVSGQYDARQVLWQDSERVFCRLLRGDAEGPRHAFIPIFDGANPPALESVKRLSQEYELKDYLDGAWALRPVELLREPGRTMLVVEYAGGQPLNQLIGEPMPMEQFFPLAVSLSSAIGQLHGRGLVHKDIKHAHVVVDATAGNVRLTGFGIASRLPRERPRPEPPEVLAGTLAYMAPEQTGRVNRSIDSRSDLYSLGVIFYEMLTGELPFSASDAMEWVHCHIARRPVRPSERAKDVPPPVCAMTMKLLAKSGEERYQTAAGVESDLRR